MILTLENAAKWRSILDSFDDNIRDIYYSPEYYELYEQMGDGKAHCFVFKNSQGLAMYPFLMNSVNDLGYHLDGSYFDIQGAYGYNGVLSSSNEKPFLDAFYDEFTCWCQENGIIAEFTRFNPVLSNENISKGNLSCIQNRKTVSIDLTQSIEEIYNDLSKSCRRAIKKAKTANLKVIEYKNNYPNKEAFVRLYHDTMTRLNSTEYLFFNKEYFDGLFENLKPYHFEVYSGSTLVASTICIFDGATLHYHLGASRKDFLGLRPNNLIFWTMIKSAKNYGFRRLHLGGGSTTDPDDSLLKYKMSYQKKTIDFFVGKRILNNAVYQDVIDQWSSKRNVESSLLLKYRE